MNSNNNKDNEINVQIDLSYGAYFARSADGRGHGICKPINGIDNSAYYKRNYTRRIIKKRQKELMEKYGFTKQMLKNVDTVLYKTLEDYDFANNTDYVTKYLNIMAKEISRNPGEPKDMYMSRCGRIRGLALEEAGISVEYDVSLSRISKTLSLLDVIKIRRMAKKQAKVFGKDKKGNIFLDSINDSSNEVYYEDLNKETDNDTVKDNIEETTDLEVNVANIEDEFLESRKAIVAQMLEEAEKEKQAKRNESDSKKEEEKEIEIENEKVKPKAKAKSKNKSKSKAQPNLKERSKYKKKISRSKSIQASKKARREALKPKNTYAKKIAQKEALKQARLEREAKKPPVTKASKTAEYKEKHKAPVKEVKEKNPVKVKTRVEEIKETNTVTTKVVSKKKTIEMPDVASGIMGASIVVYKNVNRFTRKLQSKSDSIKNKVYKEKDSLKKAVIIGAMGTLLLAISISHINSKSNNILSNTYANEFQTETNTENEVDFIESVVEANGALQAQDIAENEASSTLQDIEETKTEMETISALETENASDTQDVTETETESVTIEENKNVKTTAVKENANAQSNYLDLVRVGAQMNIESGLFFESPEGTGNYGHFENHKGAKKIISKIGILTKEGYIIINDGNISLRELKEKYPDGVFAYHFVDEDGHILGWLTSESFNKTLGENSENIINEAPQEELEER